MELTLKVAAIDKNIRKETNQSLKEYKSQSLLTQAKRGDEMVAMYQQLKICKSYCVLRLWK